MYNYVRRMNIYLGSTLHSKVQQLNNRVYTTVSQKITKNN